MDTCMQSNEIAVIIPARIGSTRLPGKPLINVKGKPIIQWVYERALQSKYAGTLIVATDDQKIFNVVKGFGGCAVMTSADHQSGSDRIAEVVKQYPDLKIVVNVQGDEPLIDPVSIDEAISLLIEDEKADISTLVRKIEEKAEAENPNLVKAVFDNSGYALYFSRSVIPYPRNEKFAQFFGHIGLYAYRRESLLKLTALPQSSLEQSESLEQLRALQNGMKIKIKEVGYAPVGIDTEEDLIRFENMLDKK